MALRVDPTDWPTGSSGQRGLTRGRQGVAWRCEGSIALESVTEAPFSSGNSAPRSHFGKLHRKVKRIISRCYTAKLKKRMLLSSQAACLLNGKGSLSHTRVPVPNTKSRCFLQSTNAAVWEGGRVGDCTRAKMKQKRKADWVGERGTGNLGSSTCWPTFAGCHSPGWLKAADLEATTRGSKSKYKAAVTSRACGWPAIRNEFRDFLGARTSW